MPEGYNRAGCQFIEFDFDNHKQNHLIESMPEQIQAVIKQKIDLLIFRVGLSIIYFILYSHKV